MARRLRPQPLREALQQLVAVAVAHRLVDHLEAVEVEEEDGEPLPPPLGAGQRRPQMPEQQAAVGQVGQRVVVGQVLDLVRGGEDPLALVLEQPGHHADPDQRLEQEVERPEIGRVVHRADAA